MLFSPCGKDGFVRDKPFECLEPAAEVVGGDEVLEVLPELVVAFVVVTLDGCIFDGAVHPLDLAIGPGCRGLVRRCST